MFRFSIRELMLVTLVVALVVGWLVDRSSLLQRQHQEKFLKWQVSTLKEQFAKVGGTVTIGESSVAVDYHQRPNIGAASLRSYYYP